MNHKPYQTQSNFVFRRICGQPTIETIERKISFRQKLLDELDRGIEQRWPRWEQQLPLKEEIQRDLWRWEQLKKKYCR